MHCNVMLDAPSTASCENINNRMEREGRHIVGKTLDLKQRKKHAANICTKEEVGKGKPLENDNRPVHSDLKDCETGLAEVVKSSPRFFILEPAAKDLHSEQRENEYKEDEEDEQGIDRGDGVDQTLDQITHRGPVSGIKELRVGERARGKAGAEGDDLWEKLANLWRGG